MMHEYNIHGNLLCEMTPDGSYMYGHRFWEPTMTTLPEGETESTRQRTRTAAPT